MSRQLLQKKQKEGQVLMSSRNQTHQRVDSYAGLLENERKEAETWLDQQLLGNKSSFSKGGEYRNNSETPTSLGNANQDKLLRLRKQVEHQDSNSSTGMRKKTAPISHQSSYGDRKPNALNDEEFENQMEMIVKEVDISKGQKNQSILKDSGKSKNTTSNSRSLNKINPLSPNANSKYAPQYSNQNFNEPIIEKKEESQSNSYSIATKSNLASMIIQQSQKDQGLIDEENNIREASQFRSRDITRRQRTYTEYKTLQTVHDPEGLDQSLRQIQKIEAFIRKWCRCFCKTNQNYFDPYLYTSGESDEECKFAFLNMERDERKDKVLDLWKRTLAKARGAVSVLNTFGDLNRKIYIHGSVKKHDYLEEQDQIRALPCVLMPNSKIKNSWNLVVMLLLLYTGVYIPYKTAFIEESEDYVNYIELSIDSLFFIDIIINFLSAYEDSDKNLEFRLSRIALSYIRTWFLLDIVSCIPFQLIDFSGAASDTGVTQVADDSPFDNLRLLAVSAVTNTTTPTTTTNKNSYNKLLKLARLPRLYRLLRILRLFKMVRILKYNRTIKRFVDQMRLNPGYVKVTQVSLTVLFLVHLVSCFYYMVASYTDFDPVCWVVKYNLLDSSNVEQYITAMYWTFQTLTTVGYGDVCGETTLERIFTILWMIFGIACYSFTIGNLQSIISTIDAKSSELAGKINTLTGFTKRTKLPEQIVVKIKKFLENNNVNTINLLESKTLLSELPSSIRAEVIKQTYQDIITKIKFFEKKDPDFLWAFLPTLKPMKVYSKDILYNQGDHPEEVFFIFQGRVKLVYDITEGSDNPVNVPFNMYVEGSYFGDLEILLTRYKRMGRDSTAIVDSECHLLVIGSKDLKGILKHFKEIEKQMKVIAKKRRVHHKKSIEEAKIKVQEKKAKALAINLFQSSKNLLNQLQLLKNKGGSNKDNSMLKAAKKSRKKLEQLEKLHLGGNPHETSRHNTSGKIEEEEEEFEDEEEEDDEDDEDEYDDEEDDNPDHFKPTQEDEQPENNTAPDNNDGGTANNRVVDISVDNLQKTTENDKIDEQQRSDPSYQVKQKVGQHLIKQLPSQDSLQLQNSEKRNLLGVKQDYTLLESPMFKQQTPDIVKPQGQQQFVIEEFNPGESPRLEKKKTIKKDIKQPSPKKSKKQSSISNKYKSRPKINSGSQHEFKYDHEQQTRLFNDTQSALALNAYDINEITDRIALQCEKRNESLTKIENSNQNISRSLLNMENLLNKILESI